MTRTTITAEEASEIARLLAVYEDASLKAAAALGRYSKDKLAPETARIEDLRAGNAYRRIREIYGDEATPITPSSKPFQIK